MPFQVWVMACLVNLTKKYEKITFELYIVQFFFNENIISSLDDVFHGNKCVLSIHL
jgi:hypothetical protein